MIAEKDMMIKNQRNVERGGGQSLIKKKKRREGKMAACFQGETGSTGTNRQQVVDGRQAGAGETWRSAWKMTRSFPKWTSLRFLPPPYISHPLPLASSCSFFIFSLRFLFLWLLLFFPPLVVWGFDGWTLQGLATRPSLWITASSLQQKTLWTCHLQIRPHSTVQLSCCLLYTAGDDRSVYYLDMNRHWALSKIKHSASCCNVVSLRNGWKN